MRTTITFHDDVAQAIERLRREQGVGVSEVVNDLVRRGLTADAQGQREPFRQRTSPMRARMDVSNVAEVLDTIDGPAVAASR